MPRQKKLPSARIRVEVEKLSKMGWSAREIADKLHIDVRSVFRHRATAKADGESHVFEIPEPKPEHKLEDEVRACIEPTPDGFERFYNRYNREYQLPPHLKRIVGQAIGKRRVLLNVPPGHAKSTIFSIWFPIWNIVRNRDIQILVLSKTDTLAKEFCKAVEEELRANDKLIDDFGRFQPSEAHSIWSPGLGQLSVEGRKRALSHGPTIMSRGAGQQVYGFRADLIIADDVVDTVNSKSDDARRELSRWFHLICLSRLRPTGEAVVVGTRFHVDDLYGELSRKGVDKGKIIWEHINFPALSDPDTHEATMDFERGIPLWPEYWTLEALLDKYEEVGSTAFQQGYQQNPIPDEDALVKPEWYQGCLDPDRPLGRGIDPAKRRCRVISIDPSPTAKAGFIVADVADFEQPFIAVLDAMHTKMGVREMLVAIEDARQRWGGINYLIIESNSAHFFLQAEEFRRWQQSSGIRLLTHVTGGNKNHMEWGVNSLSMNFEFGTIRIPDGDPTTKQRMHALQQELLTYPYGATWDLVMALWFIKFNWKRLLKPYASSKKFRTNAPARLSKGWGGAFRKFGESK